MKPMSYALGALLVTALALPAPAAGPALAAGPSAAPAPTPPLHSAGQISGFLAAFYGQHGPSDHYREYRISQALKDKQQLTDFDVLLCSQNTPQSIGIGPVTVAQSAGVGWATVTTHWDGDAEADTGAEADAGTEADTDTFTAYVRLDSRPIKLDDVICAG
ncbi:hypothetical protein MTF65_05175 [Streptomyces sp. APSN-46.1]|uniref:hypothetical protein n=1 Tax=Streptomyces sp. APSN-46.1 TaxID=2929049 RepID=UPI001FB515EF|nr:hypothetical protein [Streptomyces sp. APSN-46.1]MCJ1676748.1 hypothetical protein [Streptomyces sp. APSN-46.1]